MHWVALHSTGSVFDRLGGGETEAFSSLTLTSVWRRRKPWLSCFLQSAVNALMAAARRWHSSAVDDVAKVNSVSIAWTRSAKT